jgi:hypothetical protein
MLLALQGERRDRSIGRNISVEELESITAVAGEHGFSFGGLRRDGQEITAADIERVRIARDMFAAGMSEVHRATRLHAAADAGSRQASCPMTGDNT